MYYLYIFNGVGMFHYHSFHLSMVARAENATCMTRSPNSTALLSEREKE